MCGIAGFYSPEKKFTNDELVAMTQILAHRGPDASGFYFNEQIGLGHRRLSIIDLSEAANQPMYSHSDRYVVVFNGEIYNYRDVAADLKIKQRTTSDTEIIAEGFELMGEQIVRKLNGMFAIAIYDKREQELFLFRDRLGKKPLFYYWDGNDFAFASEIKALQKLKLINATKKINKTALNQYLHLGYIQEPHTIYENIHRFPSGSYARLNKNGFQIHTYWRPEDFIREETVCDLTTAKKQLNELVVSSVGYRMISDVPFGSFLSGGADSSLVTAVAQKISASPVNTFCIGFRESKYNESEHARKIAKHLGTNHHEFIVSQLDALDLFEQIPDIYDEPYADSSAVPSLLVARLARQQVKMTLSGDGGDESFMGYGFYRWAKRLQNPLVKALRKPIGYALKQLSSRYERASHLFLYEDENKIQSHIFSQEQYFFSETEIAGLLNPEFHEALAPDKNLDSFPRKLSPAEQQALFDIRHYLKDDLLVKVDRATMHYSLETRVPLLDYRLIEFALNVDEGLKLRGPVMKFLLKELLYDYVPRSFFDGRPKWGFAMPLTEWFKKELRYLPETYLSESVTREIGILQPEVVSGLVKRYFEGSDYLYNRMWMMIMLHKWYLKNF
ncbi:MAG: asparagine synthase (glutamine-hydrolyzing) [Chitinophagales bacterium]|nr:asparagine synthase (glutamine-hydrolyzing) [Chitinophagales bacterium]